jgi:hypothetical protein
METIENNKHYEGRIGIGNNSYVQFKRIKECGEEIGSTITMHHIDNETSVTSLVGTLQRGFWTFQNNPKSAEVWSILKDHSTSVHRIMKNLRMPIVTRKPFAMEWSCFKRRVKLQIIKIKRKTK